MNAIHRVFNDNNKLVPRQILPIWIRQYEYPISCSFFQAAWRWAVSSTEPASKYASFVTRAWATERLSNWLCECWELEGINVSSRLHQVLCPNVFCSERHVLVRQSPGIDIGLRGVVTQEIEAESEKNPSYLSLAPLTVLEREIRRVRLLVHPCRMVPTLKAWYNKRHWRLRERSTRGDRD